MGDEPASVQSGTVSVVTRLEGRRGVFETPYHGPIYVLDVATNNPGAAGGALVNFRGELAGLLGKELRNSLNNTWLSYAVPIDQLRQSVERSRRASSSRSRTCRPRRSPPIPWTPACWASCWCPTSWSGRRPTSTRFGRARPPPAGLQPDDLILMVGNEFAQSCMDLQKELGMIDRADAVKITILRGQDLVDLTLQAGPDDK